MQYYNPDESKLDLLFWCPACEREEAFSIEGILDNGRPVCGKDNRICKTLDMQLIGWDGS